MDETSVSARLSRLLDAVENGSHAPSVEPEKPPGDSTLEISPTPVTASPASASQADGLGGLLGGLAANPALLSSLLPALLSALPGAGGKGSGTAGASDPASVSAPASVSRPYHLDRHTALLAAVKPYLGERRQATADTVLRLCRVWDALERAGITSAMLTGLLGGAGASDAPAPGNTETGG